VPLYGPRLLELCFDLYVDVRAVKVIYNVMNLLSLKRMASEWSAQLLNIWQKCLYPVTGKAQPTTQLEKCLCKERSEVVFVLENLWRDLSFGTLPERFNCVESR